jgi:ketosteroid isomerase-like protein
VLEGRATEEDIERLRQGYSHYNAGDWDALEQFMTPDVVVDRDGGADSIVGWPAIRAFVEPEAFEYQRTEPGEFTLNDNNVLVSIQVSAKGATSGVELDMPAWHVWTLRPDGRATHLLVTFDEGRARAAVGL